MNTYPKMFPYVDGQVQVPVDQWKSIVRAFWEMRKALRELPCGLDELVSPESAAYILELEDVYDHRGTL